MRSKAVVTHYIRDDIWKSGGRVPLILNPLRQVEASGKLDPPATLSSEENPPVPINSLSGWVPAGLGVCKSLTRRKSSLDSSYCIRKVAAAETRI